MWVGSRLIPVLAMLACGSPSAGQQGWTTEDIRFESRGATLAGTLYLPPGPGPHPVLVGVHGSGRVDRSDLYQREAAEFFAPRGVGFFMFDKRGVGESEGTYPGSYSSSMVIYAWDALAAADRVAQHPDIDGSRLGLWGVSQAGWIIPLAASLDQNRVRYTVIISGPTVSIMEENAYSDLTGLTAGEPSGMSASEIDDALAAVEPKGLDASVFIAELRIPGLWIYGALDQSVPWRQGVEDLAAIADEFDRNFTVQVFDGANHGLRASRTGGTWERPEPRTPVDGFFDFQVKWLRDVVGLPIAGS